MLSLWPLQTLLLIEALTRRTLELRLLLRLRRLIGESHLLARLGCLVCVIVERPLLLVEVGGHSWSLRWTENLLLLDLGLRKWNSRGLVELLLSLLELLVLWRLVLGLLMRLLLVQWSLLLLLLLLQRSVMRLDVRVEWL